MLIGISKVTETCQMHGRFTQFAILNEKPQSNTHGPGGAMDEKASNIQARSPVARNMEGQIKSSPSKRKANVGCREIEARQCHVVERYLIHRSER